MFTSSARSMTMSAFLPGESVPILLSSLNALAPLIVAHSSASRERTGMVFSGELPRMRVVAHLLAARKQQRRLHLAEHLARGVELDVDADRRLAALLAERRDHGVADMMVQLDQHGRGQRRAGVDHHARSAVS